MKMWNQTALTNCPLASRDGAHDQTKPVSAWMATDAMSMLAAKTENHGTACLQIQITQIQNKNEKIKKQNIIRLNSSLSMAFEHCTTHTHYIGIFRVDFTCELNYLCDKQINMDHSFIQFLYAGPAIQNIHTHTTGFRPKAEIYLCSAFFS